jgi:hypothetical protein
MIHNKQARGRLIIELDTVRKQSNNSEYRYVNRARVLSHNLEEVGDGRIIDKVVTQLLELYPEGDMMLYIQREGRNSFNPMFLSEWFKKKEQPENFKRT